MPAQTSTRDGVLDDWPFAANTLPAIKNTYTTRNFYVYIALCIVYMQHGLPNTVSISQNCRTLQAESEIQNQLM
jgi:hypothetical protein